MKTSTTIRAIGVSASALALTVAGFTVASAVSSSPAPSSSTIQAPTPPDTNQVNSFKDALQKLKDATTDEAKLAAANELQTLLKTQFGDSAVALPGPHMGQGPGKGQNLDLSSLTTEQKAAVEKARSDEQTARDKVKDLLTSFGLSFTPGQGQPDLSKLTADQKTQLDAAWAQVQKAEDAEHALLSSYGIATPTRPSGMGHMNQGGSVASS